MQGVRNLLSDLRYTLLPQALPGVQDLRTPLYETLAISLESSSLVTPHV